MKLFRALARLLGAFLATLAFTGPALAVEPVLLDDATRRIELWPSVRVLYDAGRTFGIQDVLAARHRFEAHKGAHATLGMRPEVVWLTVPLKASDSTDGDWVLDFDYTLLNDIEVSVVSGGAVIRQLKLGNARRYAERPLAGRTHSAALEFERGKDYELFIRVDSIGAKILPFSIAKFSAFHERAIDEQTLQGVLASLALFLVFYSLLKWASLREVLYAKYALLVSMSALFSVHFFGLGEQYLWTDIEWMQRRFAGVAALLAAGATALFVEDALGSDLGARMRLALRWVAGILFAAALAHALDLISIRVVGVFMSTLGLAPALMGLPGAIRREKRGDSTGAYFIIAWVGYFIASAVMVGVVRGYVGANFWTLHSFQIGATFDMLVFMRIANLRSARLHREAQRATSERESLISMAHSDPLTGLLNRRGLNDALRGALDRSSAERSLAVYVLDLDRFKPVNDQFGHDVGDELLIAVANRLRASVRAGDAVARLGGDEFVVVAEGLSGIGQADDIGNKLLDAFVTPFALAERTFAIGATIGYALAPVDGMEPAALLKIADAGLYAGKHAGKNCLKRGSA
ncbi:MAG: GGDEF domain-containing protein [Betaproteobacteria bacterium]|nr:GGDEF domain-containing protein [Betaproteobacteria bacterium]